MSQTASARTTVRRTLRPTAVGLVVVTAAIIGTLIYQSASSSVHSFSEVLRGDHGGTTTEADGAVSDLRPHARAVHGHDPRWRRPAARRERARRRLRLRRPH